MELMFSCQQEVGNNLNGNPVFWLARREIYTCLMTTNANVARLVRIFLLLQQKSKIISPNIEVAVITKYSRVWRARGVPSLLS